MTLLALLLSGIAAYLHYGYVSRLFENDRFFSHLSTLEREMTFRTEAGFYYMHYKTIVRAESFTEGLAALVNDTGTEYPNQINSLKRFNVYPEVVLGGAFRVFSHLTSTFDVDHLFKTCYTINRGQDMPPTTSCDGVGDEIVFYVNCVFALAGLQVGVMFFFGSHLAGNLLGGLLAVSSFFFNHSEATRVQWIPPLRESFSFPFLLLQTLLLSRVLQLGPTRPRLLGLFAATLATVLPWQFSQFALFTQVLSLAAGYTLLRLERGLRAALDTVCAAFLAGTLLQFGNPMLISSLYLAGYVALRSLLLLRGSSPRPLTLPSVVGDGAIFLVLAAAYKLASGRLLQLQDDAHIFNILRSKFTSYEDFHTLLYTCSRTFDFIEWETFFKLSLTLLLPVVVCVVGRLAYLAGEHFIATSQQEEEEKGVLAERFLAFHVFQLACYTAMAVLLMRLKLFMTPYMCIVSGLAASNTVLPQTTKSRYMVVFILLGAMSIPGYGNIERSLSMEGEYNNPAQEELFEWINANTEQDAVFAGSMPIMANLRLSTGRRIVNHPHYEDAALRERTKLVYQMFSRKPATEVHETLRSLSVQFAVLDKQWCTESRPQTNGCAIAQLWDREDPINRGRSVFCERAVDLPKLFKPVFGNRQYRVIQVLKPLPV